MTAIIRNHVYTADPTTGTPASTPSVSAPLPAASAAPQADSVDLKSKPKKKGLVNNVNQFISNCKKFFAGVAEYTKGTVKGIVSGAIAGTSIYGAANLAHKAKQFVDIRKLGKGAEEAAVNAIKDKKLSKAAPAIAVVAGIATLGLNLWKSKLNLNETRSDIEHRYEGHKQ
ncbi:hypothetical protein II906_00280 [bacterium]|nr:hypothetical protein [bacterium]